MRKREEIALDIAMHAGGLAATGMIEIEDSREFVHTVIPDLVDMFIERCPTTKLEEDGLYLLEIDKFSDEALGKLYDPDYEL